MDSNNLYRKIPLEVQAVQWVGLNEKELSEFSEENFIGDYFHYHSPDGSIDYASKAGIFDKLHNTWIQVELGDWIIRGIKGEFYPCNNYVFHETYEKVHLDG